MNIEALVFDCDGTLTDSMPLHFISWTTTLARYGIRFDEDRFYELAGAPTEKIVVMLAAEQSVSVDAQQVTREKADEFLKLIHTVEPILAVAEIVQQNRGRLKLAVASGSARRVVEMQLQQIGLEGYFDAIVASEDTELHKPEPDVFLEAARRLNVPAERCRVYEDSDLGIEAARRAGMTWVDIRQFHTPRRVTNNPV
jgi:beta-phosphoglucomutase family hydrolase